MNHYERLKVNPDAPVEVIRAAYRALAAKHHPDRHTQSQSAHADMVALNAAYEVLTDPHTRAAYDAELGDAQQAPEEAEGHAASRFHSLWRTTMGFAGIDPAPPAQPSAEDDRDDTRVDVHWQPPPPVAPNPWMSRKRLLPLMGAMGVVVLIAGIWWVRAALLQMEAEQTLSQHYSGQHRAGAVPTTAGLSATRVPSATSVTMSDEQLLAEPPPMPGQPSSLASRGNHVLDGNPLSLRQETHLVDPLATEPAAGARP